MVRRSRRIENQSFSRSETERGRQKTKQKTEKSSRHFHVSEAAVAETSAAASFHTHHLTEKKYTSLYHMLMR